MIKMIIAPLVFATIGCSACLPWAIRAPWGVSARGRWVWFMGASLISLTLGYC